MKSGWVNTTIKQMVSDGIIEKPLDGNHGEIHPKKSDFVKSGVPFIMASDLKDGVVDTVNCYFITEEQAKGLRKGFAKKGDVLLCHKGTIGRTAIVNNDIELLVLTPQVTYYRINNDSILDTRYLYHYLNSSIFQEEMLSYAKAGSTRAYIGITKQLDLNFVYPTSLTQQKQIVEILDKAFDAINKAKANIDKNIENTKELFQSKLNEIFSKKGDGWEEKVLENIGVVQTGTTPSTIDKSNYGDYIPFAKPPHFKEDGSIDTQDSMLSKSGLEKGRLFEANSILMVCIGATIGKTGFSEKPISSNQQINALTPNNDFIPKLLYYALISSFVQNQVLLVGKSAQATLPIINKSKWLKLKVNLPIDKSVQTQIIETLENLKESCMNTETLYRQKLAKLEDLKKSILQKAFSGELTRNPEVV